MEFEFDNEIDAILRKARESDFVFEIQNPQSDHLGADEISAFAENVLPAKTRQTLTAHLAECARCRKILSNVIILNAEAEMTADSAAAVIDSPSVSLPWYRRFFVFPQIGYAMGALVLMFSVFFGYLLLQSFKSGLNSEVSSSNTRSAPQISAPADSTANSNATSNAVSKANLAVPANSMPVYSSNSSTNSSAINRSPDDRPVISATPGLKTEESKELPADTKNNAEDNKTDAVLSKPSPSVNQPAAGATTNVPKDTDEEKSRSKVTEMSNEPKDAKKRSAPNIPLKKDKQMDETRQVGGKSFKNVGGIWFDTAYNNSQTQILVRRGTDEYKKLDSGLRSIADQLGGTVVVNWKSKTYRIQ